MTIQKRFTNPDKVTVIVFLALLALPIQYFVFILLFPDGGLATVRSVLDNLTELVLYPVNLLLSILAPPLESTPLVSQGRFQGAIGFITILVYFYLISVVVSSFFDLITSQMNYKSD